MCRPSLETATVLERLVLVNEIPIHKKGSRRDPGKQKPVRLISISSRLANFTTKVKLLHIYKNNAYGGERKPNILAKENNHVSINRTFVGWVCKENMHLNKGDPEDKI